MDSPKQAQALQIIATDEPGHEGKFLLKEENLKSIIDKIPPGMKVGVVSVVGAFRTGKSFLLNLFLRYLRSGAEIDLSQAWMVTDGEVLLDGNLNEAWSIVDSDQARPETHSFGWRGGKDRQTTGIWMWSEPIIRQTLKSGETMAVLLMDTQGMFDNETTMTLTAQIFGLSTLVASFQVYNVDKRIQEDNLQHLALFSEYGRMSLLPKNKQMKELGQRVLERMNTERRLKLELEPEPTDSSEEADKTVAELPVDARERDSDDEVDDSSVGTGGGIQGGSSKSANGGDDLNGPDASESKPFQRLQFLVRDWQNFDEDNLPEDDSRKEGGHEVFGSPALEKVDALRADMQKYLQEVLRTRTQGDLASTREQIIRCFEQVDCFMLPHPGFSVTKKNYDGDLTKIDPFFRGMVNYYVRLLFDQELEAKIINNVAVTGQELLMYIQIYVNMFASEEGTGFPKAMTVLDATAEGNNRIALERSLDHYKRGMDKIAGGNCSYVKEEDLAQQHVTICAQATKIFDEIATMGMPSNILRFREQLEAAVGDEFKRYQQTNSLRNPFKDVEFYILPMAVAATALVLSKLVDWTCSNDFCEAVEDTFVNIYLFIFFAIIVLAWNHIQGAIKYVKSIVLPLILARAESAFDKHMQKEASKRSDDTAI